MAVYSVKFYARLLAAMWEGADRRRKDAQSFVSHLRARRKLSWLPKIIREARRIVYIRQREEVVRVETAKPDSLRTMLPPQTRLREVINPSLIGGIVIQKGDRRIDASVRADLAKLKAEFLKRR